MREPIPRIVNRLVLKVPWCINTPGTWFKASIGVNEFPVSNWPDVIKLTGAGVLNKLYGDLKAVTVTSSISPDREVVSC